MIMYVCNQSQLKNALKQKKMMTKALEAMIDRLVEDQAKETANMIDKVKYHSQEYKIIKKSNKRLIDKNNKLQEEIKEKHKLLNTIETLQDNT